jgi:hypothetical protein
MPLASGIRLGPYEILAPIGAGGMGEVYRARDTRLGREVALKVLPESFARDAERMARFEREAQVLASLNHPNIAALYGLEEQDGVRALVLELVEGPTLADRLSSGPLPVKEALAIAKQIIEALEEAHDKGIVHRDLKPANIKVREDGTVKVLDFGLAKALDPAPAAASIANSPTMSLAATRAGVILGTAAYMSPEQARGGTVDLRSDIWSFGVVLLEMLTGKTVFSRATVSDTLAAVLMSDPDWTVLPAETPPALRHLLRRCLDRDRKQRLQAIGEARIALENPLALDSGSSGLPAGEAAPSRLGKAMPWATAAVLGVVAAAIAFVHWREAPPAAESMRFQIAAPEKFTLRDSLSVSPDGRRLAFIARGTDGQDQIWVRSLEALDARPLPGTAGVNARGLFWSPDSRLIAFEIARKLKKVDASGGPAQTVCDLTAALLGGAWAPDGTIVFAAGRSPLMRVAGSGGVPLPLRRSNSRART